jgi:predicted Zn-dependent protease
VVELPHLNWEIYVINSPTKNAFAVPGGKIFVFTGILQVADTPDRLATILGHEIAHVLARHSSEQMSFQGVLIGLRILVSILFDPPRQITDLMTKYGLIMPYSRKLESEADFIGLHLMAKACYDPEASISVWQRMQQSKNSDPKLAEFLSTHPSTETRIQNMKEWMDKAVQTRMESGCENVMFINVGFSLFQFIRVTFAYFSAKINSLLVFPIRIGWGISIFCSKRFHRRILHQSDQGNTRDCRYK